MLTAVDQLVHPAPGAGLTIVLEQRAHVYFAAPCNAGSLRASSDQINLRRMHFDALLAQVWKYSVRASDAEVQTHSQQLHRDSRIVPMLVDAV